MKILKHCTDVGVLFDRCANMEPLFEAYEAIWTIENTYRKSAFSREQILDDTINTSRLIGLLGFKNCPDIDETRILTQGIRQIASHIIGKRFLRDEAKVSAAKAAWLATVLKSGNYSIPIPRYNIAELKELAKIPLQDDHAPLNKLKSGVPEAYYYWLKTAQVCQ